ncbi:MAG: peptidoglycan-binding protein [Flavobacteriales bacterium]|nr:peptidoglycan-binding protein [Flavobacteriales bacterium]
MRFLTLLTAVVFASLSMSAQDNPFSGGTPPTAELGKCYAKCYIPSEYETVTEQVLVKEGATKLVAVPAVYETVTEQVLVKEATTRLVPVPTEYETLTEQVLVKEAHNKLVPVSPVYETVTEKVLISEATTKWVMKKDKNCMSADPNDCFVACYEEVPERYTTYTSSVLKTPATVIEVQEPAEYKTVTRRVVKTPATMREEQIPAEYATVTKRVLMKPATVEERVMDPEFKTITKRRLVKAGEYSDWREVLCESKITTYTIRQIQEALMGAGYDIGPAGADNVLGGDTRSALKQYQRDNNLPIGNLNIETLEALGIQY